MKFILNKTSGINGIEKVSLEKIIQTFSVPENIEINIDKSNILDIGLKYEDINLAIFYVINFISSEITKNYITVHFVIKKLYLDENIFIEENEEINKILPKIIEYLKNNNKSTKYNIERRRKSGIYYFDNEGIAIFYQKEFNKKIVEKIDISLPYEDNLNIEVTMSKLKEDINQIRDVRSIYGRKLKINEKSRKW